jgi:omega-amidase
VKKKVTIAIIQPKLHWENVGANLALFEDQFHSLNQGIDLVVLPETFSTGFTMNVKRFAETNGEILQWMVRQSAKYNFNLTGSCIVKENGKYFNRLYWTDPSGKHAHYDKRHLFRMGREQEFFSPGRDRVVVQLESFRILLQICYDLRFPVFARNRGDYDAILYVANWPSARKHVWETLLTARAIENQAYVIGANCTGTDGEGVDNCGASLVIDPKGEIKARLDHQPDVLYTSLDIDELNDFRSVFPAWEDADPFGLI